MASFPSHYHDEDSLLSNGLGVVLPLGQALRCQQTGESEWNRRHRGELSQALGRAFLTDRIILTSHLEHISATRFKAIHRSNPRGRLHSMPCRSLTEPNPMQPFTGFVGHSLSFTGSSVLLPQYLNGVPIYHRHRRSLAPVICSPPYRELKLKAQLLLVP